MAAQYAGRAGRAALPGEPVPHRGTVERGYPLAAFPVQFDQNRTLAANATLELDHTLTFSAA